ncbi:unnamed protein product [Clonostachys chloroleuca]|uniref:F-box domain-containing protein n=1 Tax=Clonostachys chloroleuca TaxID=1926264 RepID=A0AA35MAM1_9HYPO|nr:unnamed protein product [Clonostachys chloroleuca]
MGGFDVYCAICGGALRKPSWIFEEDDEDVNSAYTYDPAVLADGEDPELNWLEDVRLIGENSETSAECPVWVSGPAQEDDCGYFHYELGSDPDPALLDIDEPGTAIAYWGTDDMPQCVPFHTQCRELLGHFLGVSEVDKALLHAVFEKLAPDDVSSGSSGLNLDYGDISEYMGQYWEVTRGAEHCVFNPIQVKGMNQLYDSLPLQNQDHAGEFKVYQTEGDPFAKLPADILLLIMSQFSHMGPVFELRKSSPAFANIQLGNGFWRKRFHDDMPWLWDMPTPTDSEVTAIDWKQVYHKLDLASLPSSETKDKVFGLCNRRRIWEQMCPNFLKPYTELQSNLLAWGAMEPPVLRDAYEPEARGWAGPGDYPWKPSTETLFDMFHELPDAKPTITADWTDEGYLVDLHARKERGLHAITAQDKRDMIPIPNDDWLTGFIITTREVGAEWGQNKRRIFGLDILFAKQLPVRLGSSEGDKRLFYVKEDHFVVALKTCRSEDGLLVQLGLIGQSLSLAEDSSRIVDTLRNNYSTSTMEYPWWRELPPTYIRLSQPRVNKFRVSGFKDDAPMDLLMLGTSDEELADITSISVDICLGGIEVTYGHQASRKVGTRHQAMKNLSIDGKGGERIALVYATLQDEPDSLTILTNRGRTLAVGRSSGNSGRLDVLDNKLQLKICGFYGCSQSTGNDPSDTMLRSIGTVGSVDLGYVDTDTLPAVPRDSNNYTWEPSMLPSNLRESGPVLGSRDDARILLPMASVVSRIDCSRPLTEVRVTLTHNSGDPILAPITAITFKHTDGYDESVGPDRFPEDATCLGCKLGSSVREQLDLVPHYHQQTWNVDGKKLTSLRIWRHSCMSIAAIQFVVEGQVESPVWGYWQVDTSALQLSEVRFAGEGGGRAVALKMFLGKITRGGYRDDDVIVGIQELVPSYTVEVRSRE